MTLTDGDRTDYSRAMTLKFGIASCNYSRLLETNQSDIVWRLRQGDYCTESLNRLTDYRAGCFKIQHSRRRHRLYRGI